VSATDSGRAERSLVTRYVTAWTRGDYATMYGELDAGSRRRISETAFAAAYDSASKTATVVSLVRGRVGNRRGESIPVKMQVQTVRLEPSKELSRSR
jgi:hypothetical protein